MTTRATTEAHTETVLALVRTERERQETRYGHENELIVDGTGPDTRWLGPYTSDSAEFIEMRLRADYEDWEDTAGKPTWVHLVREELAEAFQEPPGPQLAEELIQVAALCVSWVERLVPPQGCEECGNDIATRRVVSTTRLCLDCLEDTL